MSIVKIRVFLGCLFIAIFSSCSKNHIVKPEQAYGLKVGETLALISMTRSGIKLVPGELHYRGIEQSTKGFSGSISLMGQDDWGTDLFVDRIPLGLYAGRIILLALPPGKYEFHTFRKAKNVRAYNWLIEKNFSIPFELKSGAINYIGNFNIASIGLEMDNVSIYEYWYHLIDEEQRDLAEFKKKYPEFSSQNVVMLIDDYNIPVDAEGYLNKARFLYEKENYKKALKYINESIKQDGNVAEAYMLRGNIYYKEGLYKEAEDNYKKARLLDSQDS